MAGRHRRNISRLVDDEWSDYSIDITGSGHIKVTLRRGAERRTLFTSGTPGDHRAVLNFRAELTRAAKSLREQTK